MMRNMFLGLSALLLCSCATVSQRDVAQIVALDAEAKPIGTFIMAVKNSDLDEFKLVFSSRVAPALDEDGWQKALAEYRQAFSDKFGDYQLEDFALSYSGEHSSGHVQISFKGKAMGKLRVLLEDFEWKLDEK